MDLAYGFDQKLAWIKAVPGFWFIRAMDPVSIMLSRPEPRDVHVPHLISSLCYSNARRVCVGSVEQAEFHSRGILGKDGEVDSFAIPCGSQWIGISRPSSHCSFLRVFLCVMIRTSSPWLLKPITVFPAAYLRHHHQPCLTSSDPDSYHRVETHFTSSSNLLHIQDI